MRRRDFIAGLGAAIWPFGRLFAAEAHRRVGALFEGPLNGNDNNPRSQAVLAALAAFREGLARSGRVEGRTQLAD
jgi:hypothetical protein